MLYGAGVNVNQFAETNVFTDVPAWAQGYVNLCSSLGIVAGVGAVLGMWLEDGLVEFRSANGFFGGALRLVVGFVLIMAIRIGLKAVLPDPKSLGANYHGQTSIGCRIRGIKDGKERTYYIYNNCDHEQAYRETGTQAVSFTTGVPAALGASMWAKGLWRGAGVFNVEEFDPDPFLAELGQQGLPWHELFDVDIEL